MNEEDPQSSDREITCIVMNMSKPVVSAGDKARFAHGEIVKLSKGLCCVLDSKRFNNGVERIVCGRREKKGENMETT